MKVAYFEGDCREYWLGHGRYVSMDEIMREAQTGERPAAEADHEFNDERRAMLGMGHGELELVLVPDEFDLTTLTGDDWDDAPADCNASGPYYALVDGEHMRLEDIPGVVVLRLRLGDRMEVGS